MEKTGTKILSDIRASLEILRAQVAAVEAKVAELEAALAEPTGSDLPSSQDVRDVLEAEKSPFGNASLTSSDTPAPDADSSSPSLTSEPAVLAEHEAEEPAEEPVDLEIELIGESAKPAPAVIDVFAEDCAWKTDIPGSELKNIISGISLNDRILFINTLFKGDAEAFQNTISVFNSYERLSQAVEYVGQNYPNWNLNSEVVYRFMMAVRRKLRVW